MAVRLCGNNKEGHELISVLSSSLSLSLSIAPASNSRPSLIALAT